MMKRFLVDWLGNYAFFVPLVLLFNRGWNWPSDVLIGYLLSSIALAAVGGRVYTLFLKHVWYRLLGEVF